MASRLYVHIGTAKTGSTSLQSFLHENRARLRERGFDLYEGRRGPVNHVELFPASMRYERDSFFVLKTGLAPDASYTAAVRDHVGEFLDTTPYENVIFTTEGLGLLRFPDEVERLREVLHADRHPTRIIVYLREKTQFLRSYRAQVLKTPGRTFSSDPNSARYVEDDTWLLDYARLLSVYRKGFGEDNVHVVDYDEQVREHGSIIPAFFSFIGVPVEGFPDYSGYQLNRS